MKMQEPPLPHTCQEAPAPPNHFLHGHSQGAVLPSQDSDCPGNRDLDRGYRQQRRNIFLLSLIRLRITR